VRDRFLVTALVGVICVVLAGYGFILGTGRSFSRIEFGLGPILSAGAAPYIDRAIKDPALNSWANGEPQAAIREFMRSEFVSFDHVLLGYSSVISRMNVWFYAHVLPRQKNIPVGVDSGHVFQDAKSDALVAVLFAKSSALDEVSAQVADAKRLAKAYPHINFTYYGVSEWTMTQPAFDAGYRDPLRDVWAAYAAGLNKASVVGLSNADDWKGRFFATDHHWNPNGQYQGYLDIMSLLAQRNARIGAERVPFGEATLPGVVFRGTSARKAAYYRISEPFLFLSERDPDVHAFLDGKRADWLIIPKGYRKKPSNAAFATQYAMFNGGDYPLITYRKEAAGAGNLLILADSYSNSMEDLIASHYHNTYSVDLRHYAAETGRPFDFAEFVRKHDIDDVLVMGRPARVVSVPTALLTGKSVQ